MVVGGRTDGRTDSALKRQCVICFPQSDERPHVIIGKAPLLAMGLPLTLKRYDGQRK